MIQNRLHTTFQSNKVVLPVIHVLHQEQALRNVLIAKEAGAHGVWLIHHDASCRELLACLAFVQKKEPDYWIGVNFLDLTPLGVFQFIHEGYFPQMSGVWSDSFASHVNDLRSNYEGLYFGGVAFKYQAPVDDYAAAVEQAKPHMDVITTSGDATGQAASLDKIIAMHAAAEGQPLALASGVSAENVVSYLPYVDAFLVSTSISDSFYELNFDKTKQLVDLVNSY